MKKQTFAMHVTGRGWQVCHYEPSTGVLTVKREGVELLVAETNTPTGRYALVRFYRLSRSDPPSQSARHLIVRPAAGGDGGTTRYPDREPVHLSLVSQATL